MEPESSLPYSQAPATCPYPEQPHPVPTTPSHFLKIHLNIILPSTSATATATPPITVDKALQSLYPKPQN